VLLGDAGAIPYVSDLPALDIIGLGGYRDLPFARATRWGVSAALELIERMPGAARPDVIAVYPSWWGHFPHWFGRRIGGVPAPGNVICGAPTKVIYQPDWHPLDDEQQPLTGGALVPVDSLDVADVISERDHEFAVDGAIGFVAMKILPDPRRSGRGLFDAGRILPEGVSLSATLRGLRSDRPAELIVRTAPAQPAALRVTVDGKPAGEIPLEAGDAWHEGRLTVPAALMRPAMRLRLEARTGEVIVYHLWVRQRP
jgi:hypothetical protein